MSQDGTVTIEYSHDNDKIFNKTIKWIDDIAVANDGTLTISWNNGTADTVFNKKIKWITSVVMSSSGNVSVNYNTDQSFIIGQVKWIHSIELNSDGTLAINYNTGERQLIEDHKIKWIDSAQLTNGHVLIFTYNDATSDTFNLILPNNVTINTGTLQGEGTQKVRVSWTNGEYAEIGNPINYIMQAAVNDNEHLLVRYSDPIRRTLSTTVNWNGKSGWTDIGSLKVPYVYGDPAATNLKWSGMGMITDSETGHLSVVFTMPLTQLLDQNITAVNITNGRLYVDSQSDIHDLNNFVMNSTNTTVTKTLSGLEFQVQTEYENSGGASIEIATIFINQLSLSFVRPAEEG